MFVLFTFVGLTFKVAGARSDEERTVDKIC